MQRYAMFVAVSIWCLASALAISQGAPQKAAVTEAGDKQDAGKKDTPRTADKLEQLIAEALKNNPDIRVAESKVREFEAELHRTRLKVISEITALQRAVDDTQAGADEGKERLARARVLWDRKVMSKEDLEAAERTYAKLQTELALLQAKLPYLLGRNTADDRDAEHRRATVLDRAHETAKLPISDEDFARRVSLDILCRTPTVEEMKKFLAMPAKERREKWISQVLGTSQATAAAAWLNKHQAAIMPESPFTEKLRKALDATTQLDENTVASEALNYIREKALPGFNLVVRAKLKDDPIAIKLREPVPAGAMLQFLEDELHVIFVLRDYGIVVVSAEERMPPGAIRVVDFWKQGAPSKK
jgi:hypothetical protein